MTIKKPKKIIIGSITFNVVYDKSTSGGSFNYNKRNITIGCLHEKVDQVRILDIIIHELTEIIHCELSNRYSEIDHLNDYMFVYNHKQHTTACSMLANALLNFIE